jgi:hypothetical protein
MQSPPAAWQAGTGRVSYHDPVAGETDIDKDNWAAVFYAHMSIEMSLPVGSRPEAALREDEHA